MAVIQMPSQGGKNETGMITSWHKKTGDWVAQGDELFSFDTDDGTYTVKSQKAGRLVAIFVPEGELVHCPADVGMLSSPTPESVLKMGRQQFVDDSMPLSPRQPQNETADAEEGAGLAVSEEELAQSIPEDTSEIEAVEEPAEEGTSVPAEDPAEAEAPAQEAEQDAVQPDEFIEEETDALEEELTEPEIPDQEETLAAEEPDEPEALSAEEDAAQTGEEAAIPEETAVQIPTVHAACLSAQADLGACLEIAARTGIGLAAMVRFAAMRTGLAAYLEPVEETSLRALSEKDELPNICNLTQTSVVQAMGAGDGTLRLIVPAPAERWMQKGEAAVCAAVLNLTLCFDEARLPMEEAARLLTELCGKIENLLDLLI